MGNWIESLKILIWDLVGFLIPGFFLIFILDLFLIDGISIKFTYLSNVVKEEYILLLICYILGFVVTSINSLKVTIKNTLKKVLKRRINCRCCIKKKENIVLNKELYQSIKRKVKRIDPDIDPEKLTVRELRNIMMSLHPNQSDIVYTFRFRSVVYDSIATGLAIILLLALVHTIFSVNIVKCGSTYTVLYILMLILIPILNKSRNSFYSRSMRVPFSNIK